MVLAQKQKYGSVENDRKPRNKPKHLWSINLRQRRQEYTIKTVFSISAAGKTGQLYMEKNKIRTFPYTIHTQKLKIQ